MNKEETRVYVCNCADDNGFDFRHQEMNGNEDLIMKQAEKLGTVYSLRGFQDAINDEMLSLENSFIFISNK